MKKHSKIKKTKNESSKKKQKNKLEMKFKAEHKDLHLFT